MPPSRYRRDRLRTVDARVGPRLAGARKIIEVARDDTLVDVAYDTPAGADRRELTINSTDSITDDIDPKLQIVR